LFAWPSSLSAAKVGYVEQNEVNRGSFPPRIEPSMEARNNEIYTRGRSSMRICLVKLELSILFAAVALLLVPAPAAAQDKLLPVSVELGDVSLTKLPFVMAVEAGIYRRNGLDVRQYITPNAAELIRRSSGLIVPKEFVGTG